MYALSTRRPPHGDARRFRAWLLDLPGIGLKTASWITRNYLGSDAVAILDVHIYRAGLLLDIFGARQSIARDYLAMEAQFLAFADALGVSAAALDAVMWREMRLAGECALRDVARALAQRGRD